MPDIRHEFPISAPPARVFQALATPAGLDAWWTLTSEGEPVVGQVYRLGFGEGYDWEAVVRAVTPDESLEWELTKADDDWTGTRVGFQLHPGDGETRVEFHHTGWREANRHHRVSSFCWAMYLRLLKRYLESGERVAYARRLEA
jgi:uncharacterized protein YndB with AHSA1/START domain